MDFSRCFVGSSTKKTRHPFFWWPLCFLDLARLQQLHQIQNLGTWWDVVSGNISLGGLIWLSSAWTTWAWGMMYCPSLTMKGWLWMIAAKMICSVLWTHHVINFHELRVWQNTKISALVCVHRLDFWNVNVWVTSNQISCVFFLGHQI